MPATQLRRPPSPPRKGFNHGLLGDLSEGDRLWSFEEDGRDRRIVAGEVTRTYSFARAGVRIIHDEGEVVVGRDHLLLRDVKGGAVWSTAGELRPHQRIRLFVAPQSSPPETDAYRVGYLCGIFEGDGSLGVYHCPSHYFLWAAQLVMKDSEALDRAERYGAKSGVPLQRFRHLAKYDFNGYSKPGVQQTPGLRSRQRAVVARLASWIAAQRDDDTEWLRGWLAGIFDAEGSYSVTLRIAQRDDRRRARIAAALRAFGFVAVDERVGVRLRGGVHEAARFFGLVRPAITRKIDFQGLRRWGRASVVHAVEDAGRRDFADISVAGAPTYFAAGIASHNCYEGPVRKASENAAPARIDHEAVQSAVVAAGGKGFTVFGGEPLLASLEDLERLWAFGLEKYGRNGVQTSGRPITGRHMEMFKRYKVDVGFSIDGPDELNDARRAGTLEETRKATAHSNAMLRRCLEDGISCSLIVTLHKLNASPERAATVARVVPGPRRGGPRVGHAYTCSSSMARGDRWS